MGRMNLAEQPTSLVTALLTPYVTISADVNPGQSTIVAGGDWLADVEFHLWRTGTESVRVNENETRGVKVREFFPPRRAY